MNNLTIEESQKKYEDLSDVLSALLDSMPTMIWVYNRDKDITFFNKALTDFHINLNQLKKTECVEMPECKEKYVRECQVDNRKVFLEIVKNPLKDPDGNIVGCCGYLTDITESVLKKNNIVKKLEKLENVTIKDSRAAIKKLNNTITILSERWNQNDIRG